MFSIHNCYNHVSKSKEEGARVLNFVYLHTNCIATNSNVTYCAFHVSLLATMDDVEPATFVQMGFNEHTYMCWHTVMISSSE